MSPKRTAPSLALEAAALAYAGAWAALEAERAAVSADHAKATGSNSGAFTTQAYFDRCNRLEEAWRTAERAMGRAAVALWKAERRRGAGIDVTRFVLSDSPLPMLTRDEVLSAVSKRRQRP